MNNNKTTTMLTKITTWFRSKFHNGYKEPTINEIIDFLNANFSTPKGTKGEVITHYTPAELRAIVYNHFGLVESQFNHLQLKQLKDKVHTAFNHCDYKIVYMRKSFTSKEMVKRVALVKILNVVK